MSSPLLTGSMVAVVVVVALLVGGCCCGDSGEVMFAADGVEVLLE